MKNRQNQNKGRVPSLRISSRASLKLIGGMTSRHNVLTFYVKTFGCQMNVADSSAITNELVSYGLIESAISEDADIIIINTCTVRDHAEKLALTEAGKFKAWRKAKKERRLVLIGCAAERLGEGVKKSFPFIDLVIGSKKIEEVPAIIAGTFKLQIADFKLTKENDDSCGQTNNNATSYQPSAPGGEKVSPAEVSAYVNIMRGCNNFCSYCIVPYVRGAEVSIPAAGIIAEIETLVGNGTKEVTLLGQNVNSYHYQGLDFAGLLEKVNGIDGLLRIRYMTNHPKDINERIIGAIARLPKACNHIHLPMQSGSDRVLRLMNRQYTTAQYMDIVRKIKATIPGVSVTSDVLIGFPEETERDFQETYDLVEKAGFDFCYVFRFSARKGTAAYALGDRVGKEEKKARHIKMLSLTNRIASESNKRFIGRTVEVLAERMEGPRMLGKTSDNGAVVFLCNESLLGKIVKVRILETKVHSLIGEIVL
ncbi:MAG: tRNA (N6-isopentenyl adenosine(37)-C2)-methylthiotransferase MiaB [Desulfobacteraceae bacterium]|nr:MAG: tRNA (N6-isopentenyl adenosine(37)-C2)-methylthiotransferase MiaB [Desulfobacteraceae bacterium]